MHEAEANGSGAAGHRDQRSAGLRPLKPPDATLRTPGSFPVYPGLTDYLLSVTKHPDPSGIVPHVMATCSAYSYAGPMPHADPRTVQMIMERMGLQRNRCQAFEQRVDALFVASTAYLVQSEDRRVAILCYRGTQPEDVISYLADADVSPERLSIDLDGTEHYVHAGFYRNMRVTRHLVIEALDRAVKGQSILPEDGDDAGEKLQKLYITGHSLGGAMAALMAVVLVKEPVYRHIADKLEAVYTFGQPLIGDPGFAHACEQAVDNRGIHVLRDRVLRYVYFRDAVPHLPPRPVGRYAPFGREFRYEKAMSPVNTAFSRLSDAVDELASLPGDILETLGELLQGPRPDPAVPAYESIGRDVLRVGCCLPKQALRWMGAAARWATSVPPQRHEGWHERTGAARSGSMQNLSGFTLVAPLAFVAVKLNLTRTLPFKYSFDDHMPTHYISRLAPSGVLSEFGDVR
ncbi:lipase family protein [Streptomyces sp. NPDC050315]|uniref:lipase family protein n=1 Tax=Streptomyces sp. NPDC050315 TaxID=3155039 RepID=UPI00341AFA2F